MSWERQPAGVTPAFLLQAEVREVREVREGLEQENRSKERLVRKKTSKQERKGRQTGDRTVGLTRTPAYRSASDARPTLRFLSEERRNVIYGLIGRAGRGSPREPLRQRNCGLLHEPRV